MSKIPVANSQSGVFGNIVNGHKTIEKPIWVKDMRSYNYMPEPYRKLSGDEYNRALFDIIYRNSTVEFRQVFLYPKKVWNGLTSIRIFWQFNCGYAICQNHKTKDLEVYRIGCNHKNTTETLLSKSYYRVICDDCGFQYEYDCS